MNRVRMAKAEDCRYIAEHIRSADRAELEAASECWVDALHAILTSFSMTPEPITFEIDGLPAALAGVAPFPHQPRVGCPWLLGTDALSTHRSWFLRETRRWLDRLSKDSFDVLYNDVDIRYVGSVRWMEFLGFTVVGSVEGRPPKFIPFLRMEKILGSDHAGERQADEAPR